MDDLADVDVIDIDKFGRAFFIVLWVNRQLDAIASLQLNLSRWTLHTIINISFSIKE